MARAEQLISVCACHAQICTALHHGSHEHKVICTQQFWTPSDDCLTVPEDPHPSPIPNHQSVIPARTGNSFPHPITRALTDHVYCIPIRLAVAGWTSIQILASLRLVVLQYVTDTSHHDCRRLTPDLDYRPRIATWWLAARRGIKANWSSSQPSSFAFASFGAQRTMSEESAD